MSDMTRGTLLVSHALEALDPEIRSLLLPYWPSNMANDKNEDLEVVTHCVRHVMSQAVSGPKQQEAIVRAAQQLDSATQRVDQELHFEIVACHGQLLSTIAAPGDLLSELSELGQTVRSLHVAVGRMKLHAKGPAQLLEQRVASLERFDRTLTLITLLKRMGQQLRLFEAQFSNHLQKSSADLLSPLPRSLDFSKAAQSQREIELLLKCLAEFVNENSPALSSSSAIGLNSFNSIDSGLLNRFPVMEPDITWVRKNGCSLITIADDYLSSGLSENNIPLLITSCQVFLWYGGIDMLIRHLKPVIDGLFQSAIESFDTKVIVKAIGTQSFADRLNVSPEIYAIIWKPFQQYLNSLEERLQCSFALDQAINITRQDEDLAAFLDGDDDTENNTTNDIFVKELLKTFSINCASKNWISGVPITSLFWNRALKEFQTNFRRLNETSHHFHQFLLAECPKLSAIFTASGSSISTLWRSILRTQVVSRRSEDDLIKSDSSFGSLTMADDDQSVLEQLDLLYQTISPIIKDYLECSKSNIIQPVKLMFPSVRDSSVATNGAKSFGLPTTSDIRVYVNVIVSELNKAAPSSHVHSEVLKLVEESLILCASRLRDLRDTEGTKISFPSSTDDVFIPSPTPGHRRNAKLHEICQILCSSLLHVFGSTENSSRQQSIKSLILPMNQTFIKDLSSIVVLPEYTKLKKETFVLNWFRSLQHYICEVQLLSLSSLLSCQEYSHGDPSSAGPIGSSVLQTINELSGFVAREYFSLLPSTSLSAYGADLSRGIIQYFLATCILVKPLNKETQRVAFAAHLTSLEVTLSEGSIHFRLNPSVDPSSDRDVSMHPEVISMFQMLPSHLILLHLLSRLPDPTVPSISDYLDQAVATLASQIANSLSVNATRSETLCSPSVICSTIKDILQNSTKENGKPIEEINGVLWGIEEISIVVFMRRELGLPISIE